MSEIKHICANCKEEIDYVNALCFDKDGNDYYKRLDITITDYINVDGHHNLWPTLFVEEFHTELFGTLSYDGESASLEDTMSCPKCGEYPFKSSHTVQTTHTLSFESEFDNRFKVMSDIEKMFFDLGWIRTESKDLIQYDNKKNTYELNDINRRIIFNLEQRIFYFPTWKNITRKLEDNTNIEDKEHLTPVFSQEESKAIRLQLQELEDNDWKGETNEEERIESD